MTEQQTELEKKRELKAKEEDKREKEREEYLEASMPKPAGYMVLIALPTVEENTEGGIAKAEQTIREETILSTIGLVIDMGDQAYQDPERFSTGPWCKAGDFVMFRPNSGTRFKVGGQEYRLLADDSIQAIVPNPQAVTRAA